MVFYSCLENITYFSSVFYKLVQFKMTLKASYKLNVNFSYAEQVDRNYVISLGKQLSDIVFFLMKQKWCENVSAIYVSHVGLT